MPIQIDCPHCRGLVNVPDHVVGKYVKCPLCAGTFTARGPVPAGVTASPPPYPAAPSAPPAPWPSAPTAFQRGEPPPVPPPTHPPLPRVAGEYYGRATPPRRPAASCAAAPRPSSPRLRSSCFS